MKRTVRISQEGQTRAKGAPENVAGWPGGAKLLVVGVDGVGWEVLLPVAVLREAFAAWVEAATVGGADDLVPDAAPTVIPRYGHLRGGEERAFGGALFHRARCGAWFSDVGAFEPGGDRPMCRMCERIAALAEQPC